MLQEGGLYPGLRPRELLALFAAYYDDPDDPDALLDLVGLRDSVRTYVRRLSGGQAQRLSLACALVGRPEVLFLDEPTAGMDPHARATTWQLVRDLRERGTTILLTTHAMDEAEQLCDRVAIISAGRLAAIGSPAELTADTGDGELWFSVEGDFDLAALAVGARHHARRDRDAQARASSSCARRATPKLIAELACHLRDRGVLLSGLHSGRRSLEEVFLALTTEETRMKARAVVAQTRAELALTLAPRREPHRDARDPARHPRVLRQGRHGRDRLRQARRLPRARRPRARGDVGRDGEPRASRPASSGATAC